MPRCFVCRSLSKMLAVLVCLRTWSLRQGFSANALFGRCNPRPLRVRDEGNGTGKKKQWKVMHSNLATDSLWATERHSHHGAGASALPHGTCWDSPHGETRPQEKSAEERKGERIDLPSCFSQSVFSGHGSPHSALILPYFQVVLSSPFGSCS